MSSLLVFNLKMKNSRGNMCSQVRDAMFINMDDIARVAVFVLSAMQKKKKWFPVVRFGVRFSDVSPYVCSYYFSSVSVAEWPPFGK